MVNISEHMVPRNIFSSHIASRSYLIFKQFLAQSAMATFGTKLTGIYAISDLHVDYTKNREFVEGWHQENYASSALIVAGDVTDNVALLESVLTILTAKFQQVFFVPGGC